MKQDGRNKVEDMAAKMGELLFEHNPKYKKYDKIVGVAEVAIGTWGKFVYGWARKKQGPLGPWINKKLGVDPIGGAISDCEYLVEVGKSRLGK